MNPIPNISARSTATALFASVMALFVLPAGAATTMTFGADRDNTMLGTGGFNAANSNFGAFTFLGSGRIAANFNNPQRSILSFDVSDLDGQFTSISSITLRLTFALGADPITQAMNPSLYAISAANRGWVEGTISSGNGATQAGSSSWNSKQHGSTAWAGSAGLSTAGTDYASTLLASNTYAGGTRPATDSTVDFTFTGDSASLTALINGWLVDNVDNNQSNPGLLLLDPNQATLSGQRMQFYSREATTEAYRPQLIVTFIPEPSAALLGAIGFLILLRRRNR